MSKTVTLRVDDAIYEMIKAAADGQHRNLSNFIEFATLQYLSSESYVDESEMKEILGDKELVASLKGGLKEIEKGDCTLV
jgi:predicted transcriptional regulator